MDGLGKFVAGFLFGGACGALYTTNLFGKKPVDLVEAQKERNEEWKNAIVIKLGLDKKPEEEQVEGEVVETAETKTA